MTTLELVVQRERNTAKSAPGRLSATGVTVCYTLEDVVRADPNPETPVNEAKVKGETAIPGGIRYPVRLSYSPRFSHKEFYQEVCGTLGKPAETLVLAICDVPGYGGVRIHVGDDADDTEGCLLVGMNRVSLDYINQSKDAYRRVYHLVRDAFRRGEQVFITFRDAEQAAAA